MTAVQINKKFKSLYTSDKRYFLITGGRGSGKTFAVQDFLIRLLEQVGQGILYTRYTMTSVEKTIIPLFVEHIKLISNLSKYDITQTLIRHKETGAFILFSGIKTSSGDQTANLKTLPNITTWVIEEGEDYNNEKSFTDIDDSIRSKYIQNRVLWIQNPTHKEHFIYKKFFLNTQQSAIISNDIKYINNEGKEVFITYQKSTHPQVEHIHTTYLDNLKHLDEFKINQWDSVLQKNPKLWANKYGGAWLDMMEGAIFEDVNWVSEFPKHITRYCFGLDFGFTNDPTTLIKCGESDGELYAERIIYRTGMTNADINNEFKRLGITKNDVIYADSADPKTILELQLMGWRVRSAKKGADSIRFGIQTIKNYSKLNIVNCEFWKKEQISYIWAVDKLTSKFDNVPIDAYNHLWDALRYGVQGLRNGASLAKTKIKN